MERITERAKMEHIVSFLPEQQPGKEQFQIQLTGITYPDSSYHIIRKNSPVYVLEYIIKGRGTVRCGETQFEVQEGDVYFLPGGLDHDYNAAPVDPFQKIWMNVSGSLCDSLYRIYGLEGQYHFKNCQVYPLFRRFLTICEKYRGDGLELVQECSLLFHELLLALHENLRRAKAIPGRPEQPGRKVPGVPTGEIAELSAPRPVCELAREYLYLHIYEKVDMKELADRYHISLSQLTRQFHKEYGSSPYQYFLELKLATACSLLLNTGLMIREISDKLGFADEHYFSNLFKKKTGKTPGAYRREGNFFNFPLSTASEV